MDSKSPAPTTYAFRDDGRIPNNPTLPLVYYRAAIDLIGTPDPEKLIERIFASNNWGNNMWRNGVYGYVHYHSMIHEAMGIARGRASVRFGGDHGQVIDLGAGDVVVLPAGTGHQCLGNSRDLVVVGAYPPDGKFDVCRASKHEHDKAVVTIAAVPLPQADPVLGPEGPLVTLWRA
jgi:uncharacterized protein YjlB